MKESIKELFKKPWMKKLLHMLFMGIGWTLSIIVCAIIILALIFFIAFLFIIQY